MARPPFRSQSSTAASVTLVEPGGVKPNTEPSPITGMLTGFAPWKALPPMQIAFQVALKKQAPAVPAEAEGVLAELLEPDYLRGANARLPGGALPSPAEAS